MGFQQIKSPILGILILLHCIHGENLTNPHVSLDTSIHIHALMNRGKIRSGILYDVPLPSNYSGITASFIRFRSASIWSKGANYSNVYMPPKTSTWPFARRINIVYENLGNRSSEYYNVPNHELIAPVIGFLAYDAANDSRKDYGMVELHHMNEPILVTFPNVSWPKDGNMTMKCVRFRTNGQVQFGNVTNGNLCTARGHGHFSIVVPITTRSKNTRSSGLRMWKRWEIGFVIGVVGFVFLVVFGLLFYKCFRARRFAKMEKEMERSENLEFVWVGSSRMYSASGVRTSPTIEHTYVP